MARPDTRAEVLLLHGSAVVGRWPLVAHGRPDLALVDELARTQLAARRMGFSLRLRHCCPRLGALIELVGLGQVLEVVGEPEGGEEGGVEEVVVPDDPVT